MQTISVVGPTQNKWGQTYTRGNLFAILELKGTDHTSETGHEIIEQLESYYLADPPSSQEDTEALCQRIQLPTESTLVLAIVQNNILHIAGVGQGRSYLFRDEKWATIFSDEKSVSGPLKKNDRIFLCSPSLYQIITQEELNTIASSRKLTDIEEHVAELIHRSENGDGASFLVLDNSQEEYSASHAHIPEILHRGKVEKQIDLLDSRKKTKRLLTAGAGGILAILLIISLVVGSNERTRRAREEQYQEVLNSVTENIDEAESLVDVNPSESRILLVPIQEKLVQTLDLFPEDSNEYEELVKLIAYTTELLEKSERKYEISEPDLFIDLSWISDNAFGYRMNKSGNSLIILDRENGSIYTTGLKKKNNDIASSNSRFKKSLDIAQFDGQSYMLTDDKERQIIDGSDAVVLESFESDSSPVAIEAYAGNLYILDRKQGIIKLPSAENGFSTPRSYLEKGVGIDFSDVKDIAIDGFVWILTNDNILKFASGRSDNFFLKDEILTSAKALYTDEDSNFHYVLEDTRVIVFDKEGYYKEQYVWDGFKDATDIAVIDDKTILVLQTNSVFQIERRN